MSAAAARLQEQSWTMAEIQVGELIGRCTSRPPDNLAWQEFVRRFHQTIAAAVSKVFCLQTEAHSGGNLKPHEQLISELVDSVYRRLTENQCEALKLFVSTGGKSLEKYLLLISISVVREHLRHCS